MLAGDQLFFHERGVPLFLDLGRLHLGHVALEVGLRLQHLGLALGQRGLHLAELGAVLGHVGLGLAQRGLQRARIDGEQQRTALDVLALGEVHLLDLAGHLGLHADGGVGLHGADGGDLHGHQPLLGERGADGDGRGLRRPCLGAALALRAAGQRERGEGDAGDEAAAHALAASVAASTSASSPLMTRCRSSSVIRRRTPCTPRICKPRSSCTSARPARVSSST